MFNLLLEFFDTLFFEDYFGWSTDVKFDFFNLQNCSLHDYFTFVASLISLIIILVLCCLFIYRLIRVVGRLFMGA